MVGDRGSDSICSGFASAARHRHRTDGSGPADAQTQSRNDRLFGRRAGRLCFFRRGNTFDFLLRHGSHFGEEQFFEGLSHDDDVFSGLVVDVAVGEHGVEVLYAFLGRPVVVVLQTFLDGAKVHGMLDDFVIVRNVKFDGVDWSVEGPAELVFPDGLDDHVLQILQLVGLAAGKVLPRHGGRVDLPVDRFHEGIVAIAGRVAAR